MTGSNNDPLTVSAPELDPAALRGALSTSWGLEGKITAVHGERDRNFRIDAPNGRLPLKVHNPADGEEVLDLLLPHVWRRRRRVCCSGRSAPDHRRGRRRLRAETGTRLLTTLRDVTAEDLRVGDVRGWGLAVALDTMNPATGRTEPDRTRGIGEGMTDRGCCPVAPDDGVARLS